MDQQFSEDQSEQDRGSKLVFLPFKDQGTCLSLYTVLSVLRRMKQRLGLEAMLEYMEFYLTLIEKYNPQLEQAVGKALTLINLEKVYDDAMRKGEKHRPGSV